MTSPASAPLVHDSSDPRRGKIGVLLCHGFTGSPQSMRPWAQHLIDEGFSVRLPLLPGHGTRWEDANRTTFADWLGEVTRALEDLSARSESVIVCGLSMGGTLTLRLAQLYPDKIAGIVLVNPSIMTLRKDMKFLPLIKHFVPSLAGIGSDIADPSVAEDGYSRTPLRAADSLRRAWKTVRAELPNITMPVLLLHSAIDHVVEPINSAILKREIGSRDVTEVVLHRSFHVATLDFDAPIIFDRSVQFIDLITTGVNAP